MLPSSNLSLSHSLSSCYFCRVLSLYLFISRFLPHFLCSCLLFCQLLILKPGLFIFAMLGRQIFVHHLAGLHCLGILLLSSRLNYLVLSIQQSHFLSKFRFSSFLDFGSFCYTWEVDISGEDELRKAFEAFLIARHKGSSGLAQFGNHDFCAFLHLCLIPLCAFIRC
jgi:hypothetical protein